MTVARQVDLEPSLLGDRLYVSRRRFLRIDAAALLSLMIALLALIPARLIVPNMTDLGRPALLIGFVLCLWWLLVRLNPHLVLVGPQPMRWVVLIYLLAALISYAVGLLRGLTEMEANGADRAILSIGIFAGVLLMAADGIPNWARLDGVIRIFVTCSAIMSFIGLLQFVLYLDVTQYISIPGLEAKGWAPELEIRGSGIRVASTTGHYIELSTILAIALPFAIHLALYAESKLRRQISMVLAVVIAAGVPATMSRTGFVGLGIVMLVMVPIWTWRTRYNMLVIAVGLACAMITVKPAVVDTLTRMFSGAAEDPSITARTKRYDMVAYYFNQRPWLGRGTGTWISPQYQYLDNQWLDTALMGGIIGVVALALLHLTGISLAGLALRRSTTREGKHLCAALIASQLIAIFVGFTFDSLSFSSYFLVLALMLGLCGAVWRFTHPQRMVRTSVPGNVEADSGESESEPLATASR
ncbi:O-antigen ligase family protein [Actinoplanes sp. NPDC051851]|uniref:O-antigen ligase family protein n=1 Tax=Actinoplanes sp. NPDC051851 TaxID=3154753 RepID=UPI0034390D70